MMGKNYKLINIINMAQQAKKYQWCAMYKNPPEKYETYIKSGTYVVITWFKMDPDDNTNDGKKIFACDYYDSNIVLKYKFESILQKNSPRWKGLDIELSRCASVGNDHVYRNQDVQFPGWENLFDAVVHIITYRSGSSKKT